MSCFVQMRELKGEPQLPVKPDTNLFVPPPRQLFNVSDLSWKNGTLADGEQVAM